jgi:hypothetical protein
MGTFILSKGAGEAIAIFEQFLSWLIFEGPTGNSKLQAPSTREISNSNLQSQVAGQTTLTGLD